jgi:hypothetical protein
VDGAPTGGAEARREQREESTTGPGGQLACLVLLPVMLEHPWLCPQMFQHVPRSSILCGCINKFLYRQANGYGIDALPHVRCV